MLNVHREDFLLAQNLNKINSIKNLAQKTDKINNLKNLKIFFKYYTRFKIC